MGYKNPTGPQKFDKKVDGLSEKRKIQMGITKEIIKGDIRFKKDISKIKKKKSKKKL